MWLFKKKHQKIPEGGLWNFFEGEWEGKPLIARVNTALRDFVGSPEYQHQVGVTIPLRAPDENGFPQAEESSELNKIEDLLLSELKPDDGCLFAAVITTGGMREFVFYVSDPYNVQVTLRRVADSVQSHKVQGMIREDEDWSVYRSFS